MVFGLFEGSIEIKLENIDPTRMLPEFLPTDTIRGKITLHLRQPQQASELSIEIYQVLDRTAFPKKPILCKQALGPRAFTKMASLFPLS